MHGIGAGVIHIIMGEIVHETLNLASSVHLEFERRLESMRTVAGHSLNYLHSLKSVFGRSMFVCPETG